MTIQTVNSLTEALSLFNRKERNLLLRSTVEFSGVTPTLSGAFCKSVNDLLELDTEVQPTSWWATDYHISWIAGAFAVYLNDKIALTVGRENPTVVEIDRRLVEGNQEDVDLIIATAQHLILVEAKGHGAWDSSQLASKIKRLNLVHAYYKSNLPPIERQITFHFLLTSRRSPPAALPERLAWDQGIEPPWLPIEIDADTQFLTVSRCDNAGFPSASGKRWVVLKTS